MLDPVHISKRLCDLCQGAGRYREAPCNGCAGSGRQLTPIRLDNTLLGRARTPRRLLDVLDQLIEEAEDLQEMAWAHRLYVVHESAAARLAALAAMAYALPRALYPLDLRSRAQQILEAA